MKLDGIKCDCCGRTVDSIAALHWEQRPSVFSLTFPRDGINGGLWNMDVCAKCRHVLFDGIQGIVRGLRDKQCQQTFDCNGGDHADCCPAKDQRPDNMNNVMPFMHTNGKSTERNVAEAAMASLGLLPELNDFRTRDKVIFALAPWIQAERKQWHERIAEMNEVFIEIRKTIGGNTFCQELHPEDFDPESPWLPVGLMMRIDGVMEQEHRA